MPWLVWNHARYSTYSRARHARPRARAPAPPHVCLRVRLHVRARAPARARAPKALRLRAAAKIHLRAAAKIHILARTPHTVIRSSCRLRMSTHTIARAYCTRGIRSSARVQGNNQTAAALRSCTLDEGGCTCAPQGHEPKLCKRVPPSLPAHDDVIMQGHAKLLEQVAQLAG